MARKNVVAEWAMFGNEGASMASSQTSQVTTIQYMDNVGIILSWAGSSPVGEVFVDVSNDNFVSFETLNFGANIDISGNSGQHLISMNQLPFGFIRIRYVRASGSGILLATLSSK